MEALLSPYTCPKTNTSTFSVCEDHTSVMIKAAASLRTHRRTKVKIVVFGAHGATGKILTQQAVAAGHCVTAVTRRPQSFPFQHERLQVLGADVYDLAAVERAVAGQDAVLSTLGVPFTREPITIYSQGIANIMRAMSHTGVRRLACISSSAVGTDHDTGAGFVFDKILQPIIISTIGKTTYADMDKMEQMVMNSDLEWVIVRPSGLFETPKVTDYRVSESHIRAVFTSRMDLADFMLQQATHDQYVRKIMSIATVEEAPGVFAFMMKEAFKKPAKN